MLVHYHQLAMDGAKLLYPCTYELLRIVPPEDVSVLAWKRPYIIIDPRAGHGSGIGGLKPDSKVGVALRDGHPDYFVSFRRVPEPGQYLAFVTRAQAAFVREVMRRHPGSAMPVIIGNRQGGWATLLLAATNPDLTGPIVINGAPVATWSGEVGASPMRYAGGVVGGTWLPMLMSDIGGGLFDGAHLVQNFEMQNPCRTMFRKYAELFRDIDRGDARFLEFETWWGGFFLMTESEIRRIVEQLFIDSRLIKNDARLEPGRPVDIKAIRAPIIVLASHGDSITPPQQALNWIAETYADVSESKIRGQRIIYLVHDEIGHPGILVSSSIANKEHSEVASTLKTIELLPPGLNEMRITNMSDDAVTPRFAVGFEECSMADLRRLDDAHMVERPFAAVARGSELQAQAYDLMLRPMIRAMVTETSAEGGAPCIRCACSTRLLRRATRWSRRCSSRPARTRPSAHRCIRKNPFIRAEALGVKMTEQALDLMRDQRGMMLELTFHGIWGTPLARLFGKSHDSRRMQKNATELRNLPEVTAALFNNDRGGFAEAVIRMLVLPADNRDTVRRDRPDRASHVLTQDQPFRSLSSEKVRDDHPRTDPDRHLRT